MIPEWLMGEDHSGTEEWVVHTLEPVFAARLIDEWEPIRAFEYSLPTGQRLVEITWFGRQQATGRQLEELLHQAGRFVQDYDDAAEL